MSKQTCSLRIFTCNLVPGKNSFSVRTSLTEQVHYREIVTILHLVGKKTEVKESIRVLKVTCAIK